MFKYTCHLAGFSYLRKCFLECDSLHPKEGGVLVFQSCAAADTQVSLPCISLARHMAESGKLPRSIAGAFRALAISALELLGASLSVGETDKSSAPCLFPH